MAKLILLSHITCLAEFQAIVYQHPPKIIGIAETWFTNEMGDPSPGLMTSL